MAVTAADYGYWPEFDLTPNMVHMPTAIGTLAGVEVVVNIAGQALEEPVVTVTLTQDYELLSPPGLQTRPGWIGTATTQPQSLAAGETLTTWPVEASALVTLGAATVVA